MCGDNFAIENEAEVKEKILEAIKKYNIDMVVCGPAFNSRKIRYSFAEVYVKLLLTAELEPQYLPCMSKTRVLSFTENTDIFSLQRARQEM